MLEFLHTIRTEEPCKSVNNGTLITVAISNYAWTCHKNTKPQKIQKN